MNRAILLALALATTASAQIQLVPDNRVSVRTNNMVYLTNTVLQQDLSIIDTNLVRLYAADVTLSNRITNVSNLVVGASNRADEAYTLALNATNSSPSQLTYVYSLSNNVTMVSGTSGGTTFTVTTQDVALVQIGHYMGPTNFFTTNSLVSAVDRTSGSNIVTLGSGQVRYTTNNVAVTVTNNGSFTHTVPAGYSRCKVYVTGGGGGGAWETSAAGGGGGGGGTAIGWFRLTPGDTNSITVGKGGMGRLQASGTGVGTNGATSSFGNYLTATGGDGGIDSVEEEGDGGKGYGGTINIPGGFGSGWLLVAGAGATGEPGWGGATMWGSGGYGDSPSSTAFGSGGAGGEDAGSTVASGSGAGGVVVIEYY